MIEPLPRFLIGSIECLIVSIVLRRRRLNVSSHPSVVMEARSELSPTAPAL